MSIGVNQGRQGKLVPPEFGLGGALIQIVPPPDFVTFQNFQDQTVCITFTVQANVMPTEAVMAIGDKLRIIHFS